MPHTERELAVYAVRVRTYLENAKAELPDQVDRIEEARVLLWRSQFAAAKAIVVSLFKCTDDVPDNLSHALMMICNCARRGHRSTAQVFEAASDDGGKRGREIEGRGIA